ncbi:MAG: hypothetical protein Q8903_11080, partial [Bacteroidota bacterium]|nr:hypothetical protein [Bacteroidota bacterium]
MNLFRCIQSSWFGVKNYLIVLLFLVFGQNVFAQSYPNSAKYYICKSDNNTLSPNLDNDDRDGYGYWVVDQGSATITNQTSHSNVTFSNIGTGKNVFYFYYLIDKEPDYYQNGNPPTDASGNYFLEHIVTVYNNNISAGSDIIDCSAVGTYTLNGTNPTGYVTEVSNVWGLWRVYSGKGSFNNINQYNTTVTNLNNGENKFVWTVGGRNNGWGWGSTNWDNSCSDTVSIIVSKNPTVNAGIDQTICSGSSASLNAGGTASTYSWNNGIGSVNPVTVSPASTTTYTVIGTDAAGYCSATDAMTVTVNPLPALFSVSGSGSYCQGTGGLPVTLSGSEGGVTYTLSDGSTMAGTGNPITWNGKTAGNYTVSAQKGSCNRVMTGTVAITEIASPTIYTLSGPAYLCKGSSVVLKLSGSQTNVNYALIKDGTTTVGTYAGTGSAMIWTVSNAGTYTVTATTTGSTTCASDMNGSVTITERALPVPVTSGDVAICAGSSAQLTSNGGNSYSWSPATGLSDASMSNPIANPASTTKYTVTAKDSYGCSGSSTLTVTVTALPNTNAGSDIAICTGDVATLTATGADTYNWDGLGSSNPVTVSPTTTTTYTVTGTRNGCQKSDQVTVTVNTRPVANAGSDVTICKGTSTTLNASGGGTYQWSTGPTTQNLIVSPKSTTQYTVTVTDASGCSDDDNVWVTVLDTATLTLSPDVAICNGASTTLTVSATGGNGSSTYSWKPSGVSPSITVNPSNATLSPEDFYYSVTATDIKGCKASGVVKVTVNPLPVVSIGNLDATYCADEKNIAITGYPTSITGHFTFSVPVSSNAFSDNGDGTAVLNPVNLTPATNYSIQYTYTDGNGCTSSVSKDFYVRNELVPKPVLSGLLPLYCDNDGNKVTLNATPASGTDGVYTGVPSDFTDQTNGVATFSPSGLGVGTYTVKYTYTDPGTGCVGSKDSIFIVGIPVKINVLPSYCRTQGKILLSVTKPASVAETGKFYIDGVYSGLEGSATFDPSTADIGSHKIEYRLTNSIACTDTVKAIVVVNALPDASFTIGGISNINTNISFCENDALLTLSGKNPGGTFSSPDAGVSGNKYDPKAAGVGMHTVYYEYTDINGCTNTESATFEIKSVPTVSINNLDPAYCNDHARVDLIGNPLQVGALPYGVWTAPNGWTSDILKDNNNGHADFYPSKVPTAGTYTIKYTVVGPTGCSATAAQNVVINFAPSVDFANLPSEICENNGPVTLTGSPTSSLGTFTGDGIISQNNGKAVFDPKGLSTISHDIIYSYTDGNGCSASKTRSTVVKQPPAAFEVTGGGAYCSDAISGPVGLSGSENNINYQLYLNGQVKGSPVSGTGNTLDFGSQNAIGTYTVVASSPANLCSTQMNGNAVITSIAPPANFGLSPSSSAYCEGSSGVSLTLSASENNVVYALKEISSGTPKVIGSLNGNVSGGSLVWNNILEGKYIVEAARGACVKE